MIQVVTDSMSNVTDSGYLKHDVACYFKPTSCFVPAVQDRANYSFNKGFCEVREKKSIIQIECNMVGITDLKRDRWCFQVPNILNEKPVFVEFEL